MQFFFSYHMITLSSSPLGILTSLGQIFHPLAINTFAQGDVDEEEESDESEDNNFCISGNKASNDENGIERQCVTGLWNKKLCDKGTQSWLLFLAAVKLK